MSDPRINSSTVPAAVLAAARGLRRALVILGATVADRIAGTVRYRVRYARPYPAA